jgi:hypothetical protein
MDAVDRRERRLRAFRAADEFAVETFRATRAFASADGGVLAAEIRRVTVRAGGALVAASAGAEEGRSIAAARSGLFEARYYLSLARRLGLVEARSYRQLAIRQDAALRELEALVGRPAPAAVDSAPDGW